MNLYPVTIEQQIQAPPLLLLVGIVCGGPQDAAEPSQTAKKRSLALEQHYYTYKQLDNRILEQRCRYGTRVVLVVLYLSSQAGV
jgi:hypothetical protein